MSVQEKMKKYLIVVAHPDDEILGAGGFIKRMVMQGNTVDMCVMSGSVVARNNRPDDSDLLKDMYNAAKHIGISNIEVGDFPNIRFNNEPHLDLVQFIEKSIVKFQPDSMITHHPSDLNNDHLHTSLACQAAMRLFQRNENVKPVNELLYMEVLSSTEWSINVSYNQFNPNYFVEIGQNGLNTKIEALAMYRGVMRKYPHPRSVEAITGLAAYRGGQSGLIYAESFQVGFLRKESKEDLDNG